MSVFDWMMATVGLGLVIVAVVIILVVLVNFGATTLHALWMSVSGRGQRKARARGFEVIRR